MKLPKKEVIVLLKKKENKHYTYEQLSKLTGYHPKYLIELARQIKDGTIQEVHQNTGRKPSKAITEEEEQALLALFQKKYYEKLTDFYQDYIKTNPNPVRKYITINHFLHNHIDQLKPKEKFIYLNFLTIKAHKYYYAFSYPEEKLLFVNNSKNIYDAISKLLRVIPLPSNIAIAFPTRKGIYETNVKRILEALNINQLTIRNYYIDEVDQKIKKSILSGKYKLEVTVPNHDYDDILAFHIGTKTNDTNTFTYKKKTYRIQSNETIPKGALISIITNPPSREIFVKYNQQILKTEEKK